MEITGRIGKVDHIPSMKRIGRVIRIHHASQQCQHIEGDVLEIVARISTFNEVH
ncbi:hypothetical protein D3C78_629500 [compost metagenome]